MYLKKEQNIFKNLWFNLIVINLITFIYTIIENYSSNFDDADKIIMNYLTIGIISLLAQFFISIKKPIKHSSLNYLYIIFSINISLFLGYLLEKFLITSDDWWEKWLIKPLCVFTIIFLIKTTLWLVLNMFYKKRINKDLHSNNLESENKALKKEIEYFKKDIENLKKDIDKKS